MNYEQPELLDRLAAEYALGTLRGSARRRFERLCTRSASARAALYRWEDDWSQLSRRLPPVQPSARVWANVRARLFGELPARSALPPARRWRTWQVAAAAGLVAVALVAGLLLRERAPPLQTLVVLATDRAHPVWRLERRLPLNALTIEVVGNVPPAAGKSYELWALPRDGAPVSLGLLPLRGRAERALSEPQRTALLAADKVAVSVEPAGGSPTGSPTGPIVIVSAVPAAG
ncbi:MAG TPA: anti-sigma factor [Steroidobacteraceae bacterium]|jgi:anti-sigma-K factor RskA|nr:anti-sigma factor [Steroidobacteraceae bacterium]